MYIREHSKRILRSALYSDSLFLEDLNVMDYSLLVAVDESKKEIIVGMIGMWYSTGAGLSTDSRHRL